jgi:hypothetical protein
MSIGLVADERMVGRLAGSEPRDKGRLGRSSNSAGDSLRLYETFIGPLEMTKPWRTSAVHGMRHFLERAWRLVCDDDAPISARLVEVAPDPRLLRLRHNPAQNSLPFPSDGKKWTGALAQH